MDWVIKRMNMDWVVKRMQKQSGFTLVEVMVVVAIVGIVTGIAVAGYLSWKPGYVLRGAVSQVRGDLNRAKMRAVETRRQCRVTFTANSYTIEDGNRTMNSNQWGNVDANGIFTAGTVWRTYSLNDYPQVTLLNITGSPVVFSPRGTASLQSLRVNHPNAGSVDIAVNITGRIKTTWL